MSYKGITSSEATFFDGFGERSGIVAININGTTGNTYQALLRITSFDFNITQDTIELQSFDGDKVKIKTPTTQSWSASAEGYFISSGSSANGYSGSTNVTINGGLSGEHLLVEIVQNKGVDYPFFVKLGGVMLKSRVVIASYGLSSSTGEVQTYSLSLEGSSALQKV